MLTIGYISDWKRWYCWSKIRNGYFHHDKTFSRVCGDSGFWSSLDKLFSDLREAGLIKDKSRIQFSER